MSHDTANQRQKEAKRPSFLMIPDALSDVVMRLKLSPNESRVLWVVLRKTLRYQKTEDWIADSQIAAMTGMLRTDANKAKQRLIRRDILLRSGRKIGVHPDLACQIVPAQAHVPEQAHPCASTGTQTVPVQELKSALLGTHNRREKKDSLTRGPTEREKQCRNYLLAEMKIDDFSEPLDQQWPIICDVLALTAKDGEEKAKRKWRGVQKLDHFKDIRSLKTFFSLYKSSRSSS